jgi:eukaryotic-like serine/threonine-protein kinase
VNTTPQERWPEIERLLDQVLDSEPPARAHLLSRIRADDPELAGEIERLLQAITAADTFLREPAPTYAAPLIAKIFAGTDLAPGVRLGSYEIVRELGRGGTATVYLAHDRKHGRQVAIKVPHAELASLLGPERFLREIQIAAQLQHPNILPLHDSGEADGVLYYVMPYVEGESLRRRLEREVQLPIDDALHIAIQVADALAYAHRHGVVHRDIKPENILLSGGHPLVADFGIARAITMAGGERLHETGPLGTAPYMSPEQAAADPHLDGRSDIYSLGCVLYEMLAGEPPYSGPNAHAVVLQHIRAPIPDPVILRPTISPDLKQVMVTALAKVPGDRFATAAEFLMALERLSSRPLPIRHDRTGIYAAAAVVVAMAVAIGVRGTPRVSGAAESPSVAVSEIPRIAVLYFDERPRDSALRGFADGVTEELIHELGGVNAFRVISAEAVRRFRGREVVFDSMVNALGANTIIDGTVQRAGPDLQLRAQLIDARSGTYVDSLTVLRPAAQVMGHEDQVAQELAAALRRRLGRVARLREALSGSTNPEARALVAKAQRARDDAVTIEHQPNVEDLRAAAEMLRRADSMLARAQVADSGWLRPLIDRSWALHDLALLEKGDRQISVDRASFRLADDAVRRAPNSPEALELRGTLRWQQVRQQEGIANGPALVRQAETDLRRALDLDSSRVKAWSTLCDLLWYQGNTAEAQMAGRRALSEDAYLAEAPDVFSHLYVVDLWLGHFPEAAEWCRRGRLSFRTYWRFVECALTLMRHDVTMPPNPDSAWALVRELDRLDPAEKARAEGRGYHTIYRRVVAATISARAGRRDIARAELARAISATKEDSVMRLDLAPDEALLRLALGDKDRAAELVRGYLKARPMARDYFARELLFKDLHLEN